MHINEKSSFSEEQLRQPFQHLLGKALYEPALLVAMNKLNSKVGMRTLNYYSSTVQADEVKINIHMIDLQPLISKYNASTTLQKRIVGNWLLPKRPVNHTPPARQPSKKPTKEPIREPLRESELSTAPVTFNVTESDTTRSHTTPSSTTLDMAEDADFSTDQFALFDPNVSTGGVQNLGEIRAYSGGISLVGQQIIKHGELNSTGGDIQMVAADEVIVFTPAGENIGFELTQPVRNVLPGSDHLIENGFDGVVFSANGGDIVYSTRFVEDLMNGRDSVNQEGTDSVVGGISQSGDIYLVETAVAETLVDTIIDDVVTRDTAAGASDAGETASELEQSSDNLASADEANLLSLIGDGAATGKKSKKSASSRASKGDNSSKSKSGKSKSDKAKLAMKIDPNYFSKLRKTHLDQLIPEECTNSLECEKKKAMKDFLGKMLVDGGL